MAMAQSEDEERCRRLGVEPAPRLQVKARENHKLRRERNRLELKPFDIEEEGDPSRYDVQTNDEVRCPNCGYRHPNPQLLSSYRTCGLCKYILAQPEDLEDAHSKDRLIINAASYGHPDNASFAIDITAKVREKIKADTLCIKTNENLVQLFTDGIDPCRRIRKVLKLRYKANETRGELTVSEGDFPFYLSKEIHIVAPKIKIQPLITVHAAWYGHPNKHVKGCFNVLEAINARIHAANGKYLGISRHEDLRTLFGEPCSGRSKHLVIEYEIAGRFGTLRQYELGAGFLTEDLTLEATPSITPQIIIEHATYGWTKALLEERIKEIRRTIFDIQHLQQKKQMLGIGLNRDELRKLRSVDVNQLTKTLQELESPDFQIEHHDITELLQRRIELAAGQLLFLGGGAAGQSDKTIPPWVHAALRNRPGIDLHRPDDLNLLFGNPLPGKSKFLHIQYSLLGHDADSRAHAPEQTRTGLENNFIRQTKHATFTMSLQDDAAGHAYLQDSLVLGVPTTLPCIQVVYASWGNAADARQHFDVTQQVKTICNSYGGRRIHISAHTNLTTLFGDPCLGTRKLLTIKYSIRGFRGCCRLDESPINHLRTDLCLGYADGTDPFAAVPRKTYRQQAIDRSVRLRMTSNTLSALPEASPYAHLGVHM